MLYLLLILQVFCTPLQYVCFIYIQRVSKHIQCSQSTDSIEFLNTSQTGNGEVIKHKLHILKIGYNQLRNILNKTFQKDVQLTFSFSPRADICNGLSFHSTYRNHQREADIFISCSCIGKAPSDFLFRYAGDSACACS